MFELSLLWHALAQLGTYWHSLPHLSTFTHSYVHFSTYIFSIWEGRKVAFDHRLLTRVTYSTLFPSQLWPLFYLETQAVGHRRGQWAAVQLGTVGYLRSLFLLRAPHTGQKFRIYCFPTKAGNMNFVRCS